MNYNHLNLSSTSSDLLARSFTDSTNLPSGHHYLYDVNLTGSGSVSLSDVATFRARGGWVAGNFLPYGFVGVAIGRASLNNSATLSFTATDYPDSVTPPLTPLNPINFGPVTQSNGQNGAIAYGVTAGVGLDYALTQNIFVRGEYEYIYFAPIDGTQISLAERSRRRRPEILITDFRQRLVAEIGGARGRLAASPLDGATRSP